MGRGTTRMATIESRPIKLPAPFAGMRTALLNIKVNSQRGQLAIVMLPNTVMACNAATGCEVDVRFDDGVASKWLVGPPSEGVHGALVFDDFERLVSELKKAKRMEIDLPVFQVGHRVVTFDVGGLEWQ